MKINTSQAGHWYKFKNLTWKLRLPLPDGISTETLYSEAFEAECKSGHISNFTYSDAQNETTKLEVDKYLNIKDPRGKFIAYWEK